MVSSPSKEFFENALTGKRKSFARRPSLTRDNYVQGAYKCKCTITNHCPCKSILTDKRLVFINKSIIIYK